MVLVCLALKASNATFPVSISQSFRKVNKMIVFFGILEHFYCFCCKKSWIAYSYFGCDALSDLLKFAPCTKGGFFSKAA